METDPVATIVLHDSMETKEVDRCSHPGCYGRKVTYEASLKQIVSLMDQSESCEQQMIYGCFSAGGKNDEMPHSWWIDRHGRPQHDWNGANAGEHTCNCGLHGDCSDRWSPDAEAPGWESDTGVIADVAALPITEIRFGESEGERATHTLGGLTCRGEAARSENPETSCSSIRRDGNTRSGYHLINKENGRFEVVLCRMDLEETDPDFQVETGATIQSGGAIFDAYRTNNYNTPASVIKYESSNVNIGNALQLSTGIFTAPIAGIYAFQFHCFNGDHGTDFLVYIRQNGARKAEIRKYSGTMDADFDMVGQSVILQLSRNDQVDVYLDYGDVYGGAGRIYTHFIGYLLQAL
ncbi:unnamed protein product [Darwinula stevensoni]|uniref:C1q domain-containing protein n=1 Tax=Darwinula stevensoni TaxID=69355 RepID=A0A7R9ABU5_9CRUS|nr:unnamed protein product [Darwinula stevensoni]CAG0899781.1 unnamed protein product [Darwinula stevensoni]